MNLTKNQWIIVAVLAAIAVWYFFLRKKDTNEESGLTSATIKPRPATGPASGGTTGGTQMVTCPAGCAYWPMTITDSATYGGYCVYAGGGFCGDGATKTTKKGLATT